MNLSIWLKREWLFTFSLIVFLLHQAVASYINVVFLDSFLDDVVFFPIVLPVVKVFMTWVFQRKIHFSKLFLVSALAYTAFMTEFLFPLLSEEHTADPLDILAYSYGLLLYLKFSEKRKLCHRGKVS